MNPHIKALFEVIVNFSGNTAIFKLVPPEYKAWAFLFFNIAQLVYAHYDTTYAVHILGKKDKSEPVA